MKTVETKRKKFYRAAITFLCFLAVFALLISSYYSNVRADIAPAGQVISSISTASYDSRGSQWWVSSNEISLSVLPFYRPAVIPSGTVDAPAGVAGAFGGETVFFPFYISNSGNDLDSYSLSVTPVSPSDFIPSTHLYIDIDGDSTLDTAEPEVQEVGPLGSGEGVHLLLAAELPQGLLGGEVAHLRLKAVSMADTASFDDDNVVRVVARDEARVDVSLSSDVTDVLPGDQVTYHVRFSNTGERSAVDVVVSDFIDYSGLIEGAVYRTASAHSSYPGRIEYLDGATMEWVDVEPPAARVKGVRLVVETLPPQAQGELSFLVDVDEEREAGNLLNSAVVRYTSSNSVSYELSSNEVLVRVGMVAHVAIGPEGDPLAPSGSPADRVTARVNGTDSVYYFWHEVYNGGNFADTISVCMADSLSMPEGWSFAFVDSSGTPLSGENEFSCALRPIPMGRSRIIGTRYSANRYDFASFEGRALPFSLLARSKPFPDSTDTVEDVFIKGDIPVISIEQSIKEPTAMPGDILSFMVTVRNITDVTTVDSVVVRENLGTGLHFSAGDAPRNIRGNDVYWLLGALGPGEKKTIVFQSVVKAGQEWGRLSGSAWAFGTTEAGDRVSDGPAVASVRIVDGVFSRKGIVFGGVFEDMDGDDVWDEGERGIGGVGIYLDNGVQILTDSSGYYSIPEVEEGTHLLRLDPASLPDSLEPNGGDYFGAGSMGEALLVLPPSGNRRVDFALRLKARKEGDSSILLESDFQQDSTFALKGESISEIEPLKSVSDTTGSMVDTLEEEHARSEQLYDAITIPSTHFAEGRSELEDIPLKKIASLSLWLREHPGWKVMVEGHTDSIPVSNARFPSNLELSLARARSVYQVLLMNGIPRDRVDYTGYGARRPVAPNSTPEGRARNRRVEIKVIPPEGYLDGDPHLKVLLPMEKRSYPSLSDSNGICADIVKPEEGRVFRSKDRIDIEVLSPLGSNVELYVNNVPVGIERVGKKTIDLGKGTIGFVFYGVKIKEGENEILVVCKHIGGEKNTCVRHVYLAARPASCLAESERVEIPADGKTVGEVVFLVSDAHGLPVRDGIFATVEGPRDLLSSLDKDPEQNGIQVPTKGGKVVLNLPPSSEQRAETIRIEVAGLSADCDVRYVSPKKSTFALGYFDGSIGYGNLSSSHDIHNTAKRFYDGLYAEGKVSVFGWGEVAPGHLLTYAVNTRPRIEDRLFARVNPERQKPLLGDASELKFNTESRVGTYVSLQSKNYQVRFGDFRTALGSMEFNQYRRAFNGLRWNARFMERVGLEGFVTKTDQITYQEEIPGEGTSGFYFLKNYPLVENSEKVRIEVRDRFQPEKILKVDFKQVNRDYDINYLDGSILFKEPVPSRDEDLNPVYIVVSYECRNSSAKNLVYGVRGGVDITDSLSFHTMAVLEEEGVENSSIVGFDLDGSLTRDISVATEFAHSEKFSLGSANAYRIRLSGENYDRFRWSTYYRNVDQNFYNPSFTGGKTELGSRKFGADLLLRAGKNLSLSSKSYRHSFMERSEKKGYFDIAASYESSLIKGKMGLAGVSHEDVKEGAKSSVLMLSSVSGMKGRFKGELAWDQILAGEDVQEYPNRLQGRLSTRLWKKLYATLKHEYRTGVSSGTRHLSQFALESAKSEKLQVYSRYRIEGAVSGERGMAIMGMKERFSAGKDISGSFSIEKQATVSGVRMNDFFSVATACSYAPSHADYILKGNYELRVEPERYKHLASVSGIKRESDRLSYMVKGELWFDDERSEANRVKGKGEAALALRPRMAERLAIFTLIRGTYEHNSPAHPEGVDRELLLSIEGNYAVSRCWQIEGKVAGRWLEKTFRSYSSTASTYLYQGELVRIFKDRWDIRFTGRMVNQVNSGTLSFGSGVEVGRALTDRLWVGLGYNFSGNRDRDTVENEFTSRGFYLRMRCKFTEKLFAQFIGD